MANATQTANKRAEELLAAARADYEKIGDEIGKYEIKRDKAAEEMKTASEACNLKEYNHARAVKEEAEAALTMYTSKRDRLEGEPLIQEAEYRELCNGIMAEVDNYFTNLKEELYAESAKLEAKHAEAAAMINDANATLKNLQENVYRGADLTYNPGGKLPNRSSVMEINNRSFWDLIHWAGRLNESATFQEMKKERGANE